MNLEQVLAQWVRGKSTSSGPSQTSVAGRWTNEYGSVAEITVDGDRVFDTYTSAVGGSIGSLSGPISGFVRGTSSRSPCCGHRTCARSPHGSARWSRSTACPS